MSMLIVILVAAVVVLPLISVIFYRQGGSLPQRLRLAASAHALPIGLVVPCGLAVDALKAGEASPVAQLPIYAGLLLGGASMLYSSWVFRKQSVLYLAPCHDRCGRAGGVCSVCGSRGMDLGHEF